MISIIDALGYVKRAAGCGESGSVPDAGANAAEKKAAQKC